MIIMIGHSPNMFPMPTLWLLHRLNATYPIIYEISGPYFGKNVRFLVHYWPKIDCKGLQLSKCFSYAMFTNYNRWARGEKRYSLRDKSQCTHQVRVDDLIKDSRSEGLEIWRSFHNTYFTIFTVLQMVLHIQ